MHLDTWSIKQLNTHFKFCHLYSFPLFRSIHSFCSPWSHIDISQCLENVICFPLAFVCTLTISGFLVPIPAFTDIKLLPAFLAFHRTATRPFHRSSKPGIRRWSQKSLIPRPIPPLSTHPTDSKKSTASPFLAGLSCCITALCECLQCDSEQLLKLPFNVFFSDLRCQAVCLWSYCVCFCTEPWPTCRAGSCPLGRSSQTKFCQTPLQISSRLCGKSGNHI